MWNLLNVQSLLASRFPFSQQLLTSPPASLVIIEMKRYRVVQYGRLWREGVGMYGGITVTEGGKSVHQPLHTVHTYIQVHTYIKCYLNTLALSCFFS